MVATVWESRAQSPAQTLLPSEQTPWGLGVVSKFCQSWNTAFHYSWRKGNGKKAFTLDNNNNNINQNKKQEPHTDQERQSLLPLMRRQTQWQRTCPKLRLDLITQNSQLS